MSPRAAPPAGSPPDFPDMVASYDAYFGSGLYHARYRVPNRRTLRHVRRHLGKSGKLLDFGAGDGRYALPLAEADGAEVLAVDVSPMARSLLAAEAEQRHLGDRVEISDGADDIWRRAVDSHAFDVALLAFGVLGHVAGREERRSILRELRSCLKPEGRLIMGLPNASRRFRREQRAAAARIADGTLEAGDILYSRRAATETIRLFYHLFREAEIGDDLDATGFEPDRITGESFFPERFTTSNPAAALFDDALCAVLPAGSAYGFLVVARPR